MLRLLILLLALVAIPATAQLPPSDAIATRLVAESARPAPGRTVTLAIEMTPKPGWHGYWLNPGDAGTPPRIEWDLPAGVGAGPLRYPVPETLTISGLMNHVYEGPYAQLVDLALPAGLATGTALPIRARFDYLACTDTICVPQRADLALDLVIGDGASTARADFDRHRAALPRPLGVEARFERAGDRLRIGIPLPASAAVADPHFFAATEDVLDYAAPQAISRNGDWLVVETTAEGTADAIDAVLRIGDHQGLALTARPGAVPAAGDPIGAAAPAGDWRTILLALGGAILGGLLLNIMPCVFPILSLKALSLARAGGDAQGVRREAVAYAAGAILLCLALGGTILALRAGGSAAGWAFQLQDPRVILLLLLLVTAIALNLAGLFALPQIGGGERLAGAGGTRGAFWTGALAAIVATPCTGPFMGAALGAALVLPTAAALAVFGGLGLGLALPFLALGFIPALRKRLPKPGPWMARLQRILSVPMFLTALALAWVLGRQAGVDGMTLGLGAALVLALSLWWVGRGRGWSALLPGLAAAGLALWFVPTGGSAAPTTQAALLAAEPFSEARLAAFRAEGRPVFAYFTADWCITCKVNEAGALRRDAVAEAFEAKNVAVLVGDWTNGDPEIGRFLAAQGRSGVPLYVYYPPRGEAKVLPQVLTVSGLVALTR